MMDDCITVGKEPIVGDVLDHGHVFAAAEVGSDTGPTHADDGVHSCVMGRADQQVGSADGVGRGHAAKAQGCHRAPPRPFVGDHCLEPLRLGAGQFFTERVPVARHGDVGLVWGGRNDIPAGADQDGHVTKALQQPTRAGPSVSEPFADRVAGHAEQAVGSPQDGPSGKRVEAGVPRLKKGCRRTRPQPTG